MESRDDYLDKLMLTENIPSTSFEKIIDNPETDIRFLILKIKEQLSSKLEIGLFEIFNRIREIIRWKKKISGLQLEYLLRAIFQSFGNGYTLFSEISVINGEKFLGILREFGKIVETLILEMTILIFNLGEYDMIPFLSQKYHFPVLNYLSLFFIHYDLIDEENPQISLEKYEENLNHLLSTTDDFRIIDNHIFNCGRFFMSYYSIDNQERFRKITKIYRKFYPSVNYISEWSLNWKMREQIFLINHQRKIRIGFLSSFYHRIHSVLRDRMGVIINLDRTKFDVFIISTDVAKDKIAERFFQQCGNVVVLSRLLDEAIKEIDRLKLDILIYSDIGMNTFTDLLAMTRIVPIQATTWGHSDTSGIDTIDYYFTSRFFEKGTFDEIQKKYTEKVLLFERSLGTYYYRPLPAREVEKTSLEELGLKGIGRFILCPQSSFKFRLDFVKLLNRILTEIDDLVLVLIRPQDRFAKKFYRLFNSIELKNRHRIIFLKNLPIDKFQSLVFRCYFVLDTYPFGSCNGSFEAFNFNKPVITRPGEYINGRFTCGLYQKMGFDDLTAQNEEEYFQIVKKLWQDEKFYLIIREKIEANQSKIFEEEESVKEWGEFCGKLISTGKPT